MTQAEELFRIFDKKFIWEYRVNDCGADVLYTNRKTLEHKTATASSLQKAFDIVLLEL